MKILILGGGGREHALVWKLRQSPAVEKIWCAPGNGGIANDAECLSLDLKDVKAAAGLAEKLEVDLTIVGPELPLVLGIADEFATRGLALLGPKQKAAQLEGSKIFAKQFMQRHGVPTAPLYGIYDSEIDAYTALCAVDWPLVVKADGLCGGKGVLVTSSPDVATSFISRLMENREFGDAGNRILLEEGLAGEELSYIILADGKDFIALAPTRDHKRVFDGDEGPNTGGMGAFSFDDILAPELELKIVESIVRPTLIGLDEEGIPYRGFLYFGLMLTSSGPKLLEYNCRLGDPEAQALLLRADFDLAEACFKAASGKLADVETKWAPGASVCVVLVSEGYPERAVIGKLISGLEDAAEVAGAVVLHAGTRYEGNKYYTNGGRILGLAAKGKNLEEARRTAYDAVSMVQCEGAFCRKDIGVARTKKERPVEARNG